MKEKIAQSTIRVDKSVLKELNLMKINEDLLTMADVVAKLLKSYKGK